MEFGWTLLDVFFVDAFRSFCLIGEWEVRLVAMVEGEGSCEYFMSDIWTFINQFVEVIRVDWFVVELIVRLVLSLFEGEVFGQCFWCEVEV